MNQDQFIKQFISTGRERGYSDDEIRAQLEPALNDFSKSSPISTTTQATPQTVPPPGETAFEKLAPTGGSILGGFMGPVGTAAGYSIGDTAREVVEQYRTGGQDVLANLIGQKTSAKLTPYGQQRAEEVGLNKGSPATPEMLKQLMQKGQKVSEQPEFSYGQATKENLQNPENWEEAGKFAAKNVTKSVAAGLSDFAVRKVSDIVIKNLLPKINPKFKAGGLKPEDVVDSANEAANEVWRPMQTALEKANKAKKAVDVTDTVIDLQKKMVTLENKYGAGKMGMEATEKMAGIQNVLDEIVSSSDIVKGRYVLKPTAAQDIISNFGTQSFQPSSGLGKISSDLAMKEEINARHAAAPAIKKALISVLKEGGLEDAEKIYKDYAALRKLTIQMRYPSKNLGTASIMAGLLGGGAALAGAGGLGVIPGATLFLSMTPIGQQILRETIKAPFKAAPAIMRTATPTINDSLSQFLTGSK